MTKNIINDIRSEMVTPSIMLHRLHIFSKGWNFSVYFVWNIIIFDIYVDIICLNCFILYILSFYVLNVYNFMYSKKYHLIILITLCNVLFYLYQAHRKTIPSAITKYKNLKLKFRWIHVKYCILWINNRTQNYRTESVILPFIDKIPFHWKLCWSILLSRYSFGSAPGLITRPLGSIHAMNDVVSVIYRLSCTSLLARLYLYKLHQKRPIWLQNAL